MKRKKGSPSLLSSSSLPMAPPTLYTILRQHHLEVEVFQRVLQVEEDAMEAKNILSFWMWQRSEKIKDSLLTAAGASQVLFERHVAEAKTILDRLRLRPVRNPLDLNSDVENFPLPHTVLYYDARRAEVVGGMVGILDGVGRVIFDVELIKAARDRDDGVLVEPGLLSKLMSTYGERIEGAEEDSRSMLVCLVQKENCGAGNVKEYFLKEWGGVVERVDLDFSWTVCEGKIVFQNPSFLSVVLEGEEQSSFNNDLWKMAGRRFSPWFF